MLLRGTILTLVVAGAAVAAPIPPYRQKPAAVPISGDWVLIWGGSGTGVTLGEEGAYRCRWSGGDWYGSWAWDARTRTIHVCESSDGRSWMSWQAQLDERLVGVAVVGVRRVPMSLQRIGK